MVETKHRVNGADQRLDSLNQAIHDALVSGVRVIGSPLRGSKRITGSKSHNWWHCEQRRRWSLYPNHLARSRTT